MIIYAWIGEDELGSGVVGIKQGLTPAGLIPLVSVDRAKLEQKYIKDQLTEQAKKYGKPITLGKFELTEELQGIMPWSKPTGV
jgi:hypothetical protein